ncbi:MAG: alanine--tRNA ligase [Paenibacillaceae bacterium]|nr:alanine--tRNA ligase [Paenibacillaceae bacterium]
MNARQIRTLWIEFFASKGHHIEPSASLVPHDDASLLWINAGMAPLKPYFDGRIVPKHRRIANAQKCIRTNDIENVGVTARHLTFFEMLGNFSLNDYFKEEAIVWAWEFLTGSAWLGLPASQLHVTVHPEDDEAVRIWRDVVGVHEGHITRCADNFWDLGEGPCGPCSEVFFDRGDAFGGADCVVGGENERYLEVWNLVFTQYNHLQDGRIVPLPSRNIDTGAGLERLAVVLQQVPTAYDTDVLAPLIAHVARRAHGNNARRTVALRCIADHARTLVFALTDGVRPSNEGRGYVLRRLLRRAVRYGKTVLGISDPFVHTLVPLVVDLMADAYPTLRSSAEDVAEAIKAEEVRFHATLSDGLVAAERIIAAVRAEGRTCIDGADAFLLYDTYGFPLDLTMDLASEQQLDVDVAVFAQCMEAQRARARAARMEHVGMHVQADVWMQCTVDSAFVGYAHVETEARVAAVHVSETHVHVVLDQTPFYVESGGQVSDTGQLVCGDRTWRVQRVWRAPHGQTVHDVSIDADVCLGDRVVAHVDRAHRLATMRHHTATHLLHEALQTIVGRAARQAGSSVHADRLRFDVVCAEPIGRDVLDAIEQRINTHICAQLPVETTQMPKEQAFALGAMALFGEKYGDMVRVVRIGDVSTELCGGTHVSNTGLIGACMIVSESGIGAGVRRIEAVVGEAAYAAYKDVQRVRDACAAVLKTSADQLVAKTEAAVDAIKTLTKQNAQWQERYAQKEAAFLVQSAQHIAGIAVVKAVIDDADRDYLRLLADVVRSHMRSGIVVFGAIVHERVLLLAAMTPDLVKQGWNAGALMHAIAPVCGGKGGGQAHIAQAGGQWTHALPEALDAAASWIAQAAQG